MKRNTVIIATLLFLLNTPFSLAQNPPGIGYGRLPGQRTWLCYDGPGGNYQQKKPIWTCSPPQFVIDGLDDVYMITRNSGVSGAVPFGQITNEDGTCGMIITNPTYSQTSTNCNINTRTIYAQNIYYETLWIVYEFRFP